MFNVSNIQGVPIVKEFPLGLILHLLTNCAHGLHGASLSVKSCEVLSSAEFLHLFRSFLLNDCGKVITIKTLRPQTLCDKSASAPPEFMFLPGAPPTGRFRNDTSVRMIVIMLIYRENCSHMRPSDQTLQR